MIICQNCGKEHDGSFGSGKYCSRSCSTSFAAKIKASKKLSSLLKKPVECVCGELIESTLEYNKHIVTCEKVLELRSLKIYKCDCGEEFNNPHKFGQHKAHCGKGLVDSENGEIYKCVCGKEFTNAFSLGGHKGRCKVFLGYTPKDNFKGGSCMYKLSKDYIAVDLESATGDLDGICQIGLYSGKDKHLLLVRPPDNYYQGRLVSLGMNPDKTVNSPSLLEVIPEVKRLLSNKNILVWNGKKLDTRFIEKLGIDCKVIDVGKRVAYLLDDISLVGLDVIYNKIFNQESIHSFVALDDAMKCYKIAEFLQIGSLVDKTKKRSNKFFTRVLWTDLEFNLDTIKSIPVKDYLEKQKVSKNIVPEIFYDKLIELFERRMTVDFFTLFKGESVEIFNYLYVVKQSDLSLDKVGELLGTNADTKIVIVLKENAVVLLDRYKICPYGIQLDVLREIRKHNLWDKLVFINKRNLSRISI